MEQAIPNPYGPVGLEIRHIGVVQKKDTKSCLGADAKLERHPGI
jgi:hypothetical protein